MFCSAITLSFDPERGEFDSAPLDEFSRTRDIVGVKDHFFTDGGR